jgi:septum site-determining protein MinD
MTHIISVISGKGGVGKTTLVSNLGTYLAKMGKRVLLIDGNLSGANLGVHLGMPEGYPFSLNHVLRGDIPIDYAVCKHHLGLEIIPASISDIEVKPRRLKHMLSKLLGKRDFILIDSAAGIDNEVRASVEAADSIIIVVNPEMPSVISAMRAKMVADESEKDIMGVVINRSNGERFELGDKEIEKALNLPVLAKIPEHKKVRECIANKKPIVVHQPDSSVSYEVKKLAHKLAGEKPPKIKFWHRVRMAIRK